MREQMILGSNAIFSTDCKETGLNNNVLVVGGSGCGKTMSIAEPKLLETYDSSLVVTVSKRRIVKEYGALMRKRGYRVLDLDFANLQGDTGYNPLIYVRSERDITFLAQSIVSADGKARMNHSDPYWDMAAINLLSAEIAYVMMTIKNPSMADVLDFHDSIQIQDLRSLMTTSVDDKMAFVTQMRPNCYAIRNWKCFRSLPAKTAACVLATLSTGLRSVFNNEICGLMRRAQQVQFAELATQKTVLFVTSSPLNSSLQRFINIFYGQLFKELFEIAEERPSGRLDIPVQVLCDDFATGGKIQDFAEYISIFREKGISVTLLLQSESQLAGMYGATDAVTIINNCDSYVYIGGMDIQTTRNMSIRMNVPMDEILYMPLGDVLVFRRGQAPIRTKRYDILSDARYQSLKELNAQADKLQNLNENLFGNPDSSERAMPSRL